LINEGVINFDLDFIPDVNVVGNGENLPFLDEEFDLIINQAVLEHVKKPEKIINEIFRVLKKSGYVYVETPFLQEYHGFPLRYLDLWLNRKKYAHVLAMGFYFIGQKA